ncbi:lytic murein transglycosylase [Nocardioides mangrovi]|uniref:Lytic murein transglycosylase n=1 Tax=Nocardioides mangrovi TaxID=2874580 RepID=A0ABS7UEL4_9ACTN|nr:lytic murein transglycosylase [Nocardioides mangrovi]MBZ5739289.1 lytic murein transglycosylase [Nocardioides mangrovi]
MSRARFGRGQKAIALVPLAVLSVAWTATIAGTGSGTALADATTTPTLPDGSTVPSQAIEAPASVSSAGGISPDDTPAHAGSMVATASTSGIPAAALAAYQRAETVINSADKGCHLPWQLVAAIGRVESDHGRANGNSLDAKGVARPGIFGPALDGKHGTSKISDTDAGQYDADAVWDRAVGPMQFIPSTWSVVGVDADGDGQRDPQDINDAALATAVYLCSGDDDLSSPQGQRAAVYRYNHSASYVDLVLSIMNAYLDGEFTSVPNGTTSAGYLVPAPDSAGTEHAHGTQHGGQHHPGSTDASSGSTDQPSDQPSSQPTADPTQAPSQGQTDGPKLPLPSVTLPTLPSTSITPVDEALSRVQAIAQCTLDGYIDNILRSDDPFDQCVYDYMHPKG